MPQARPPIVAVFLAAVAVVGCSPTTPTPSASPTAIASSSLTSPAAAASPPVSSLAPSAETSAPPATSQVLVQASAREQSSNPVRMTAAAAGRLFVEVPRGASRATVLASFDSDGRVTAGWPVTLDGATYCDAPLPVDDGSVRILCTLQNTTGGDDSGRAYAFDAAGRALAGWPVEIDDPVVAGRVVGDSMRVLARVATDVEDLEPTGGWYLLSIDAAGRTTTGVVMPALEPCCQLVAIGPDGAAYGVVPGSFIDDAGRSRITAFDLKGTLPRFPTRVRDESSGVAFDLDGNIWVLAASMTDRTSRVGSVFDTTSAPLPFEAAHEPSGDTGACESTIPLPPLFGSDGMLVLYSDVDDEIYAVDHDRQTAHGWPFRLPDPLVHPRPGPESEHEAGYCPEPLAPAIGPDGTVYLAVDAHNSSAGGSLLAVGPSGKQRAGWPVGLKRAGAEFWALAVGGDGTVYTIAFEPEGGGTSTATLLAIAPDSSILYRTTIIAPG